MGYFDLFDFLFSDDADILLENDTTEYVSCELENQEDNSYINNGRSGKHKMLRYAEQYTEYIAKKYKIKHNSLKFHKKVNIILNILAVLGLSVFAYSKKLGIVEYLIFMIMGFIIFDIFSIFFEKIVLLVINIKNKLRYKKQLKRFKRLSLENQLLEIKEKKKQRDSIKKNAYNNSYYEEDLEEIDREIEEYNKNIKDMKETDEKIEDVITKRYLKDISYAEKILLNLDEQKEDYPSKIEDKITEIVEQCSELISICKNEPILIGNLMKTFNIYLVELCDILNSYKKMSNDERNKNKDKLNSVFKELGSHLSELKDKIQTDSSERFNNNIDLLLQSLKEDRKEEK